MDNNQRLSQIMNLIGYGLAKFDFDFIKEFGFSTKISFSNYIVNLGLANTIKSVSNRQDSFDPYFDNGRQGWWQRQQRKHIKLFIDSLFGNETPKSYANIVKMYINEYKPNINIKANKIAPIVKSKFKQLQETGKEAEFYFMENFTKVERFKNGVLEDARLWGDGYDFQIQLKSEFLLSEIKGISDKKGAIRFTENEYSKANEFQKLYYLIVISNLEKTPKMTVIENPLQVFEFSKKEYKSSHNFFHTKLIKW